MGRRRYGYRSSHLVSRPTSWLNIKGDVASVSGTMQVSQWTGQNGETRQGYQVIADSVISARAARPGGNRRKTTGTQGNQPPAGGDDPYGDGIPF